MAKEKTYRARIAGREPNGHLRIISSQAPSRLKLMFLSHLDVHGKHDLGTWGTIKQKENGEWEFFAEEISK